MTNNPYNHGSDEFTAWHLGYEGRIFMSTNGALSTIYDIGRQAAVDDVLKQGHSTSIDRRVIDGNIYFVLVLNGHDVFKSMMVGVVEKLKESIDTSLTMP